MGSSRLILSRIGAAYLALLLVLAFVFASWMAIVPLLMAAVAYWILQQLIIASQGPDSILKKAIGGDWKGKLSPVLYAAAIPLAFWWQWISLGLYVFVALLWLIPDRRIENVLRNADT